MKCVYESIITYAKDWYHNKEQIYSHGVYILHMLHTYNEQSQ